MNRVLALDVGDVRIGMAYSDTLGISANPLESYKVKGGDVDFQYIASIISKYQIGLVVIGLPLNMDGTEGPRVEKTRAFAEKLEGFINVPIDWQDERLSTVTAEEALIEQNVRREKRKTVIDKVAAVVILRAYLDRVC